MKMIRVVVGLMFFVLGVAVVLGEDGAAPATGPASQGDAGLQKALREGHFAASEPAATERIPSGTAASTSQAAATSSLYGTEGEATRVVYIIDHSGSLLDNFDFLREELKRSVANLGPLQYFNVVMVSEETHTVLAAGNLTRASAAAKKEFNAKLAQYRAQGMNDDLLPPFQQAFEEAFKDKPDLIWFLTDGHFDPKLMAVVDKLNKDKKVRINTLAFINKQPGYEEQLQEMAKKNGGVYKFVSEKDLGGR